MRNIILFLGLFYGLSLYSQSKAIKFFNENGTQLSEEEFYNNRDYSQNLDVYLENDSIAYGILLSRRKFGNLDAATFHKIKSYLGQLRGRDIDPNRNIVINYLTEPIGIEDKQGKTGWNILGKNYLKKLHKIADIEQFYVNSPKVGNLKFYHLNSINWLEDHEELFKKLFFPYETVNGNYILIKPDGRFFYYLGEHSKFEVWENAEKFFL